MEKETIVKNDVKETEIKVRKDLNDIVKSIKFVDVKFRNIVRHKCNVTLFNDVVIEFNDTEKLFELFKSYVDMGETDFVQSKELVEECKKDNEGEIVSTYICVRYTLKDGGVYRLFTSSFNDNKRIENYYNLYKKLKKQKIS